MNNTLNPIKFYQGDENRIVIEKDGYDHSIFAKEYISALLLAESIYRNNTLQLDNVNDCYGNNTIIFCGDRGEGKTSCMQTVRYIMQNTHNINIKQYLYENDINLHATDFTFLPVIDPIHFDNNHNILELFLGLLYQEFKDFRTAEQNKQSYNRYLYEEAAEQFSNVKCCLSQLSKKEGHLYDELEELDCLSAGMSLKKELNKLLKLYLTLTNKRQLVICIDDMDFNIVDSYKMSKDIYTYLNNPYCILLVTVKLTQLSKLIQNHFENKEGAFSEIDSYSMSYKFIQKLFPISHRIEMPKIRDIIDFYLEIYGPGHSSEILHSGTIKDLIPRLIFYKTRYLFYNHIDIVSPIIPTDLRSLRQLVDILVNMPNIKSDNIKSDNKRRFKNYFFNTWIKSLGEEDAVFASRLIGERDRSQINQIVINHLLKTFFPDPKARITAGVQDWDTFYSFNVSVGDVLRLVSYVEKHITGESVQRLLFFIKSFYSIRLYEFYDLITESDSSALNPTSRKSDNTNYLENTWYKNTNALQRFVNGEYFNFDGEGLIPMLHDSECHFWTETLLGAEFHILLNEVVKQKQEYSALSNKEREIFQAKFKLIEYFILNITCETDELAFNNSIRKVAPYPYYLLPFSENTLCFVYNVMGIFSNMINVKHAYDRFYCYGDLYAFADENEWSLLNLLRNSAVHKAKHKAPRSSNHALASDSILRNAEIILSITEHVKRVSKTLTPSSDLKKLITDFYKGLSDIKIMKYSIEDETGFIPIQFHFLSVFVDFLEKMNTSIFNEIILSAQHELGINQQNATL